MMKLKLESNRGLSTVVCELKEILGNSDGAIDMNRIDVNQIDNSQFVFSDSPYQGFLEMEEGYPPTQIVCYLNGEVVECSIDLKEDGAYLNFCSEQCPNGNIFRDCYGYVQIEMECIWDSEQNIVSYRSSFIGVMLRTTKTNEAIQKMAEYVYSNHDKFLWKKNTLPFGLVDLTKDSNKNLEAQIALIQMVQRVYEHNLPYLKMNAHTMPEVVYRTDDFVKLRQTSPKVLQYIVQHPDDLIATDTCTGIAYHNRSLYPQKTLVQSSERILNNYENRVVVGFLRQVIEVVRGLIVNIKEFLDSQDNAKYIFPNYILSTTYILQSTRHNISNQLKKLETLALSLNSLFWAYRQVFSFECEKVVSLPKASAVFRSVIAYRQIYDIMSKWFLFGCYDFSDERFMLPLLINNQLYEYYGLMKIASQIINSGYPLKPDKCRHYNYPVQYHRYRSIDHNNTFVFENASGATITLYFQPVIWGQQYNETISNGIALGRTTTLSIDRGGTLTGFKQGSNSFYTPDYVLKFSDADSERYIVLDAKLSSKEMVIRNQVASIAFKYQFSIQPRNNTALYLGIVLLYGKSVSEESKLQEVHDIYPGSPFFYLVSYTESEKCTEESKRKAIAELIQKLTCSTNRRIGDYFSVSHPVSAS